jgi:hypothetical protein
MSIATLKRKTNSGGNPRNDPISGVGSNGFALNGTLRNIGGVGQFRMVSNVTRTPYRGNTPVGWGGNGGAYPVYVFNSGDCCTNDDNIVKKSTKNTAAMIDERFKGILFGTYPNTWVKDDENSYRITKTQGQHIAAITNKVGSCNFSKPLCCSVENTCTCPRGKYIYIGTKKKIFYNPTTKSVANFSPYGEMMSQGVYITAGGLAKNKNLPTPSCMQHYPPMLSHRGCNTDVVTWQEAKAVGIMPPDYMECPPCDVSKCDIACFIPVNTSPPEISSSNTLVGSTITTTDGIWMGYPAPTLTYQWYRGALPISGATSSTYTIQTDDVGQTITYRVTATNTNGSRVASSSNAIVPTAPASAPAPAPPVNTPSAPPTISGNTSVGSTLTCFEGTWTGYPAPTYMLQWYRNETAMFLAMGPNYTIRTNDIGQAITCRVTASNESGFAIAISNIIYPTAPASVSAPPVNTPSAPPTISGNTSVGSTLTCFEGTWTGYPAPTYMLQWYRNETAMFLAMGPNYTIRTDDIGQAITCRVTASNESGLSTATSNIIYPTGPPTIISSPQISRISGTDNIVGSTLFCLIGFWRGYPGMTFSYKWYRGTSSISGATSSTYTIQPDDVGQSITCEVTGTNDIGFLVAPKSNAIVPSAPPVNTPSAPPTISGNTSVGSTLTCSQGTWSGYPAPTYMLQWYRNETAMFLAMGPNYTIRTDDIGQAITCRVTASNASGSAIAISNNTITPTPAPTPFNVYYNLVKNSANTFSLRYNSLTDPFVPSADNDMFYNLMEDGVTLTISPYQNITFLVTSKSFSTFGGSFVNGTYTGGDFVNTIITSILINSAPPVNKLSAPPVISGNTPVGSTLTSTSGTWTGFPAPTFEYRWYRGVSPISGAVSVSYVTQNDDLSEAITCRVIGTNASGSAVATSNIITPTSTPPTNNAKPMISGTALLGNTLTCSNGIWSGSPTPRFEYQWYRGDSLIFGSTNFSYVTQTADLGQSITCSVTAINEIGSAVAISDAIIHGAPPVNTPSAPPTISGNTSVGSTLTCFEGTWSGYPAPTYMLQWYRNETAMFLAMGPNYTIRTIDIGQAITCRVTASNASGSAIAISNNTITPTPAPTPFNVYYNLVKNSANTFSLRYNSLTDPFVPSADNDMFYNLMEDGVTLTISPYQNITFLVTSKSFSTFGGSFVNGTYTGGDFVNTIITSILINSAPPVNKLSAPPVISGNTSVGSTLTSTSGTWTGFPAPTFAYQWYIGNALPQTINGATANTYKTLSTDGGQAITCRVTATNTSGSAVAISNAITPTAVIVITPPGGPTFF